MGEQLVIIPKISFIPLCTIIMHYKMVAFGDDDDIWVTPCTWLMETICMHHEWAPHFDIQLTCFC